MCNTREENAAEPENEEEGLKTVNITRSALIEKLIEYRSDDWDHHDTDEVLEYGRIGFIELSNEDLERIALDYMLEENGVEVAYHITDADTSKPSDENNTQIVKDIVELLDGTEWGSQTLDDIANLLREGGYQIRDPFYSSGPVSEEN